MSRASRCCLGFEIGFAGSELLFLRANCARNPAKGLLVNCDASVGFLHFGAHANFSRLRQSNGEGLQELIDCLTNALFLAIK